MWNPYTLSTRQWSRTGNNNCHGSDSLLSRRDLCKSTAQSTGNGPGSESLEPTGNDHGSKSLEPTGNDHTSKSLEPTGNDHGS